jgi:hypothetical protein
MLEGQTSQTTSRSYSGFPLVLVLHLYLVSRSLAMTAPDSTMIAEVTFFSQGFRTAEKLALKIVPFFRLCDEQLSQQSHYDFTLRHTIFTLPCLYFVSASSTFSSTFHISNSYCWAICLLGNGSKRIKN